MITKNRRLAVIQEIVDRHSPGSQGMLLKLLHERGFAVTQTTLSRDIKQLKISKMPDDMGKYTYTNPNQGMTTSSRPFLKNKSVFPMSKGFISFEFSYHFGVVKTRPGYANGISSDIENHASSIILGTISDNDTILIIPKEGVDRQEIITTLGKFIPDMRKNNN